MSLCKRKKEKARKKAGGGGGRKKEKQSTASNTTSLQAALGPWQERTFKTLVHGVPALLQAELPMASTVTQTAFGLP